MDASGVFSERMAAGWLLVLSGVVFVGGGMLYAGRAIWKWPAGQTRRYLLWERGFVIAALLVAVLGFTLLQRMLLAAGDGIFAPAGLVLLAIGAAVVLCAETFSLSLGEWLYAPTVAFVILAFLAQALFGAALLTIGFLPRWVGWAAMFWNLGWLVVLPITRPKDMYYPWLHYVAPLIIGITLILGR